MIDEVLAVEPYTGSIADLDDAEVIPLAEGFVGEDDRVFAGGPFAVVPKTAGSLVGTDLPFSAGFGGVPNLDLGCGP